MHRILNIAGNEKNNDDLIEQPKADFIFITSVKADINIISNLIADKEFNSFKNNIRALEISNLNTFAQIDNYFLKTINYAKVVVLRLFGDKGTWSYGIDKLIKWQELKTNRTLLILSGTEEQDLSLNELSSINLDTSIKITKILRSGGKENYRRFLYCLKFLVCNKSNIPEKYTSSFSYSDPYLYNWKKENGFNVGIISYKSLFLANEIDLSKELIHQLRSEGLSPKTVFVSTLKDLDIQKELINLFKKEDIKLLITTTSFSSSLKNKNLTEDECLNIFRSLNLPILQILSSNKSREDWMYSSTGMNSTDLLMQIIIPEFDGRITTKPSAFKEVVSVNKTLCSSITSYKVDIENIKWVTKLASNYIKLNNLCNFDKKISLIIANYPVKNGRIGNGVGLNTPKSLLNILYWLKEEGYDLGSGELPKNTSELMSLIIKTRTNDIESQNNNPLDYLSLNDYLYFWEKLPKKPKNLIVQRWGIPSKAQDLEDRGFSINGLSFGKICLLIQPQRGYDIESNRDIHSPDLPPPHRYLAQYHWIANKFDSNAIVHVGKHGTVEWLPGKSIGLSDECFPSINCPPIPNIYPFIVNDPGEGSQAKRRTHATIIDHLTPPLDRSELYGKLSILEQYLDEYYEAKLLNSSRIKIIEKSLLEITRTDFKDIIFLNDSNKIEAIDSYVCELKETQIRTGLHTFGSRQKYINEINLLLSISRVPSSKRPGIVEYIASNLNLDLEPWTNNYDQIITDKDKKIFSSFSKNIIINFRRALEFLEYQAKYLLYYYFYRDKLVINDLELLENKKFLILFNKYKNHNEYFYTLQNEIQKPIVQSTLNEKHSFINSLNAIYVNSGPSGAPTRGKTEVLPTGKNFYSIDSRSLPTESAWIVGTRSASQIIDLYKQDLGQDLKKLAISVWATSTMRNGGEDICQILYLLGVKPIWDGASRRVIDLEIIPLSILNRPRVDVTLRISGMFRDAFPQLISLINKAISLVANLDEDINLNPILDSFKNGNTLNRIFGSAPGSYGAGLQELISNSSWDNNNDFAESYLNWSKWIYSDSSDPIENKKELENVLKNVQLVIHNQDNREHDILDSDDYYQFQGGISSAIKKLSGNFPEIYHGDLSKFRLSKINKLSYEINKVVRTRVLNPKWIDGMKENGYKGAFEFSATLDYLYAYDATTQLVSDWCYNEIYNSWICDEDLKKFFIENNPWALRDLSQRFLEIINREMWKDFNPEILNNLKEIINVADAKIENNDF